MLKPKINKLFNWNVPPSRFISKQKEFDDLCETNDVFKAYGMCKTHAIYYHPSDKCNDPCKQHEMNKHSLSLDIAREYFLRMKLYSVSWVNT